MKLIIDIGNTTAKIAVYNEDQIIEIITVESNLLEAIDGIFRNHTVIKTSIVSAVSKYDNVIHELLTKKTRFIELTHETPVPFINKYGTPETLGKDRIAIASAGVSMFPGENVLLIDAGTCVTYDIVNSKGEYLGGSISPGFNMRLMALNNYTGKLPLEKMPNYNTKLNLTGNTTKSSILSGAVNGLKTEVFGIINQYESQFSSLKVVISGGDYKYFEKTSKSNIFACPNIVIYGLKEILDFNE